MAGLKPLLKDIADAIRTKLSVYGPIPATELENELKQIKMPFEIKDIYCSVHFSSGNISWYLGYDDYDEFSFRNGVLTIPIQFIGSPVGSSSGTGGVSGDITVNFKK